MAEENEPACCPGCGKSRCFDSRGVVVAYDPRAKVDPANPAQQPQMVERKYQCRLCGIEFSIIERAAD